MPTSSLIRDGHSRLRMKRFYTEVAVATSASGFSILLDSKPILTPGKAPLLAPTRELADRIAAEWRNQERDIDPLAMPLTQLLNTAIDRVPRRRAEIVAEIANYAPTDLVCFRAARPAELVRRQSECWDPMLDWLAGRHGARLVPTVGVRLREQDATALERIRMALAGADDCRLAGLHLAAGALGSVVLALALAEERLDPEAAFQASQLDELHQIEVWGEDREARARLDRIRADIATAAEFMKLCSTPMPPADRRPMLPA